MSMLNAFAISGALIAAVAVWVFLQYPGLLLWAAFIGWASFHHSGGDNAALKKSVVCSTFGVSMCWIVAMVVATGVTGLPAPVAAALAAGLVTLVVIRASSVALLSVVPATFYGFATGFGFLSQTPGKFTVEAMTSFGLDNVLIVVPVSLTIGSLLGVLQVKFAGTMMEKPSVG